MPTDQDIILGLIQGIESQPGTMEIDTDVTGVSVNIEDGGEINDSSISDNTTAVRVSLIPPVHQQTAISLLEELGDLAESPDESNPRIREILSWFESRVPTIYYTLTSLDLAQNLSI